MLCISKPAFSISFLVSIVLLLSTQVSAQKPRTTAGNRQMLAQLASGFDANYQASRQQLVALAKQHGWALRKRTLKGETVVLQRLSPLGFPIYIKTLNNTISAATTNTTAVQAGGDLGLNLSGSSSFLNGKLAIWDGGSVYAAHQEFSGKTITNPDAAASNDHATHVAGTLIAKGVYAPARGMAFGAGTLLSYDFNNDLTEMSSAAPNLLLSNHSYGAFAGWDYDDINARWNWYGLPGDTVDYKFGFYDDYTQGFDRIAYNAPYYTIVFAAGNSRGETGPAIGGTYYGYRSRTDQTFVNQGPRPSAISSNAGYDIMPFPANAKNLITVGAVTPLPFGPASRQDVAIADYSSWGPTDDGRIKPDLVGNGNDVLSTTNTGTTDYLTLSGTSMAAPNVTGSLYLLQEYYAQTNQGSFMRSATLKALACHTAFDGGNTGPDYIYGWGLLNTRKAAQVITDNGGKSIISETVLQQGQTQVFKVIASGNGVLAATIAWTDPEGAVTADGTINDRTPKLVNDLDLRVTDGSTTYMPWVLNPDQPAAAAQKSDNIRDNIEQVLVEGATPGKTFTITVTHKRTLQSGVQAYAMVVTGSGGSAYCTSAPASSADSKITAFSLSNLNTTATTGCTTYIDYTALTGQLELGKTYPLSISLGTCGADYNKIAKVYIDWNANGVFTDAGEQVAVTGVISGKNTYTTNITVPATVIPGNFSLMRIVLAETGTPNEVTPCGTYAKGETQDYRVQFLQPRLDVGLIDVQDAVVSGTCAGPANVTVTLKNYGIDVLTAIPVRATIKASDGSVTTLNGTYTGALAPLAEDDFTLTGTFTAKQAASYEVTAVSLLAGDATAANNSKTITYITAANPVPAALAAYYCNSNNQYLLTGAADGQLLWYSSPADALPVAYGPNAVTKTAPVNNTFYAGLNDFKATVGPATKSAFTGGTYNQFTPSLVVSTQIPVVIQSARLYIGNSGRIRFTVTNSSGQVVSTNTIAVTATRTTPAAGSQPDDVNDQGNVYTLNLLLPEAGNYTISLAYLNGATTFRSNAGVTGYPFTAGGIFSITGNSAGTSAASLYYYFYNMQVISAGCPSTARVPVMLTQPVITQTGETLTSNISTGNQWYLNGQPISGATGQTYTPVVSGSYQVQVTLASGCTLTTNTLVYLKAGNASGNNADINLSVFPVPASTQLTVGLNVPAAGQLTLSLVGTSGKTVYRNAVNADAGNYITSFSVASLAAGTYVLKLQLGEKIYSSKVIIAR